MRTMFKGFTTAVFAVGLAAAAHAETKPGTPAPTSSAAPEAKPVKDKRYCIVESRTGTRVPSKICKTRAEWLDDGVDPLDSK